MHQLQNHFAFNVAPSNNGLVEVSFKMEGLHVQAFITMLESLSGMFRIINNKAKVAIACQKLPENRMQSVKFFEEYSSAVIETYKILRKDSPLCTRELVSLTLRDIKENYPNTSYDPVKQILSKAKLLKGTDFYRN